MTTAFDWFPWLPAALNYAEWIVAGVLLLAAIGAAVGLTPFPFKGWALAAVFLIAGVLGTGIELHNARTALKATAAKQAEADAASTKAEQAVQAALVAQGATTTVYTEKILHDPPSACPPSAAARDASRGLRELGAKSGP